MEKRLNLNDEEIMKLLVIDCHWDDSDDNCDDSDNELDGFDAVKGMEGMIYNILFYLFK